MPRIDESITIERDAEDVFAFVSNPANDPVWQSGVETSEIVDGTEVRVGTRIRNVGRFLGRKLEFILEVTQHDPPKIQAVETVEGPFSYTSTTTVEPQGAGCRLTLTGEAPSLGGFFGKISDPLVVKMFAREVRGDLEKLKVLLEEELDRDM